MPKPRVLERSDAIFVGIYRGFETADLKIVAIYSVLGIGALRNPVFYRVFKVQSGKNWGFLAGRLPKTL